MLNNKLLPRRQVYSTKYKKSVKTKEEFVKKFNYYLLKKYARVELRIPNTNIFNYDLSKKISYDLVLIGKYKRKKNNINECILANIILKFINKPNFNKSTELRIDATELDRLSTVPLTFLILINHDNVYLLNVKHINKYKILDNGYAILARRENYKAKWPLYVKCGWKKVFSEMEKIIKKSNFL